MITHFATVPFLFSILLDNLEKEEFQVVCFRHGHEDRMIRGLLAEFDLAECHACISGCFLHHFHEEFLSHEVRAGAGGKVAASWQDLHRAVVDFLVAAEGFMDGLSRLCESRRIEDDVVEVMVVFLIKFDKVIKNISLDDIDIQVVGFCILLCHVDGFLRNVDSCDRRCAALGSI